jgi:DNA-directed RNA polymerase specialized sigma24 family protein
MNNNYIEKEELVKEWEKWRDSGDKPETRTISERLGEMIYLIAVKLLTKRHFVRYPQDVKDELAQEGCLKCIKSLKNIDPKKGSVFAYLTMTCWSAFMNYLVRYYK